MTSEYMNNLYRDLLSNSPQTVTIPIPSDMGTGQIAQVVTKQGAVVSDWKMNYFSDMNVRGINSEDYIQMLFCLNDGVSWNIAGSREGACLAKGESCIYRGHGKMESLCYAQNSDFYFKNIKIPVPYFKRLLQDYFEDGEITVYEKKLLTGISKVSITPYMEHIFAELQDFTHYRGGLGYLFLESKIHELLSVYHRPRCRRCGAADVPLGFRGRWPQYHRRAAERGWHPHPQPLQEDAGQDHP